MRLLKLSHVAPGTTPWAEFCAILMSQRRKRRRRRRRRRRRWRKRTLFMHPGE